jgi:uncharacterized damage-inducible protein DinB
VEDYSQELAAILIREFRRRVWEESLPRILQCLDQLSEEEIWYRPNENSNSIGNLVWHLEGNARQWIRNGLGGEKDERDRVSEFDRDRREGAEDLKKRLTRLQAELDPVLEKVSPHELTRSRPVQVYEESGMSILIHVIEHFSYHTGQIAWITKALRDKDLGFYAYLNPDS